MPNKPKPWTVKDIPNLAGKLAIVTGGNAGLGFETCLVLAGAGATVILAGRNEVKGKEAIDKIKAVHPEAKISFGLVDLGNLASVAEFAKNFNARGEAIDILVNNAGIMTPPQRQTTSDGFEIQFGTNHLAHFALTAQLLSSLRKSQSARIVNVSSLAARQGKINFEDINWEKSYPNWGSYAQSKLANLLFTSELQRLSEENSWGLCVASAHPGYSRTELVANGPGNDSFLMRLGNIFTKPLFSQSAENGAMPQLFAATSADVKPGVLYGPDGFYEMKGNVAPSYIPNAAKDKEVAKKLWEVSEKLTNVTWN